MAVCKALWGLWWHMCALFLSTGKSTVSIPWGNPIFPGTCSEHEGMRLLVLEQCWWSGCYPAHMQAQLLLADSKHFLQLLVTCLSILGTSRGSMMGINPHPLRIASGRGWVGMGRVWQLTTSTHCWNSTSSISVVLRHRQPLGHCEKPCLLDSPLGYLKFLWALVLSSQISWCWSTMSADKINTQAWNISLAL